MDRALTRVSVAIARSLIARRWLGTDDDVPLGTVTLRPHQREAVARARVALEAHGGVLIADEVGLGKTFIALALAADARRSLVVGPAALRSMWSHACTQTGVRAEYRSYEALSRAPMPAGRHDLVVLDEAHHARTTSTARYRHLARGLSSARVVLLTATPIHNSARDLRALLALFLGAVAWTLEESDLAMHVIRREEEDVPAASLPALVPPQWLTLSDDDELLAAIVSLPPPVPPRDGGDGGALLSFTLARLWASSHAALRAALARRVQRARALEDALSCGRHPTVSELRAWTIGEDAAQLAFPELVTTSVPSDAAELLRAVRDHAAAIDVLRRAIPADSPRDRERAARLQELSTRHAGEKIVAFTQFSDTAVAMFRLLRDSVRCCQLGGRGAQVAGGRLSRKEAIARFAPRSSGARTPPSAERIDLLIATDLLSEGVNLQDASVVVHLDFPWTSARMEQRVGRSRRMGALHSATSVYGFAPPAAAETLLRQEQRLRDKLHAAARLTGACGAILPVRLSLSHVPLPDDAPSPTRAMELLRRTMAGWHAEDPCVACQSGHGLPVARARADQSGALALVRCANEYSLLALLGVRASERPADLLSAARLSEGREADPCGDDVFTTALARAQSWCAASGGAVAAGVRHTIAGAARREAMQRIAHIAARTPHHHRSLVAPLAAEARRIVTAPYGVGAERILAELASAPLPDEAWLRAVRAFGEANTPSALNASSAPPAAPTIEAMILFGP